MDMLSLSTTIWAVDKPDRSCRLLLNNKQHTLRCELGNQEYFLEIGSIIEKTLQPFLRRLQQAKAPDERAEMFQTWRVYETIGATMFLFRVQGTVDGVVLRLYETTDTEQQRFSIAVSMVELAALVAVLTPTLLPRPADRRPLTETLLSPRQGTI